MLWQNVKCSPPGPLWKRFVITTQDLTTDSSAVAGSLGLSAWKRIHAHIVRLDSDDICASCSSWHKCLHGAVR